RTPMALTQKLEIRHGQALVMTPQLMQAIKLLQLSNLDLAAYVEGELERNPLLERASEDDGEPDGDTSVEEERGSTEPQSGDWVGKNLETSRGASEDQLATQPDNVFPDEGHAPVRAGMDAIPAASEWAGVGARGIGDCDYNLEAFVSAETTLADHLAAQ